MASLAATAWPRPLALVPCLSWSTASTAFTEVTPSASLSCRFPLGIYNLQCLNQTLYLDSFLDIRLSDAIRNYLLDDI